LPAGFGTAFGIALGTALADAFVTVVGAASFGGKAFAAVARTAACTAASACVGSEPFFDDSRVVLGVAAFADAFEAFAFTTAPLFTSTATLVVGTIGPSCRGEGDRR
jgi:hypothetical protein